MTGNALHSRPARLSLERVVALIRQGLNGQQIATRMGVNRSAIYDLLHRNGTSIDKVRKGENA